jgi:hypothetical protein
MNTNNISRIRLKSQQITSTKLKTVKELVGWMCAMQAQDFAMAKWAIGVRTRNLKEEAIEESFNNGEILRIHILRPTWHFIASENIYWMLNLTAPHIKASTQTRLKTLELDKNTLVKSFDTIIKTLSGGKHKTREEITKQFEQQGIKIDNHRSSHIMFQAELEGIVCSGKIKGKNQTYTLLEERIAKPAPLSKEEALARLARQYFTSHCPASISDFVWWSGLTMKEAKLAIELVKHEFIIETIEGSAYYISNNYTEEHPQDPVFLLPAFDEFLISYRNREASLDLIHNKKAVSDNGIFRPIVVENGKVTGIWSKTQKKDKTIIQITPFQSYTLSTKEKIEQSANAYAFFAGKEVEVQFNNQI